MYSVAVATVLVSSQLRGFWTPGKLCRHTFGSVWIFSVNSFDFLGSCGHWLFWLLSYVPINICWTLGFHNSLLSVWLCVSRAHTFCAYVSPCVRFCETVRNYIWRWGVCHCEMLCICVAVHRWLPACICALSLLMSYWLLYSNPYKLTHPLSEKLQEHKPL